MTLGVGQFCTSPGLIVVERNADLDGFRKALGEGLLAVSPGVMLNAGIRSNFEKKRALLADHEAVVEVVCVKSEEGARGGAALYETTAAALLADGGLMGEVFGPATLLVVAETAEEMVQLARALGAISPSNARKFVAAAMACVTV